MSKLPTSNELLTWIRENPRDASKRDVARAFNIKGADRIELKRMLKELTEKGLITKERKHLRDPNQLPPVSVLRVLGPDANGDLFAEPAQWEGEGEPPRVHLSLRPGEPALGEGDRILARTAVSAEDPALYSARLIRRIGTGPRKLVGIFRAGAEGGRIVPIDKKSDREWQVAPGETHGARDGELVEAEQSGPKNRLGLPRAAITERLGNPGAPKAVSLIAIYEHGLPDAFPDEVLEEAAAAQPVPLGKRTDLRHLPLITIDPADARDHDDAICAIPTPTGFTLWVAIADVAAYVTPGSALNREARIRGNSTYFPDRVVPMLPEALSADLCSLHEGEDRPCIAVEMHITKDGTKTGHTFHRALMRCPAALAYEEAQAAVDGTPNARTQPFLEDVLTPLFAAYRALAAARERRQPLNLDLPERQIVLSDDGHVTSVNFKERLDAHKLVEEFMVLANVAAAETLEQKQRPVMYRVHEEPSPEKLDALRETAQASGLSFAKGQVLKTKHLNALLDAAAGLEEAELINLSVLRSMTQAYYAPENFGHFGLHLQRYAHFTSPIRRYADLLVHRALITAHGWGDDGLSEHDIENLAATGELISQAERRSMIAERDTTDRYLAAYLADRTGSEFAGRVSGIAKFGLFVKLSETGADGLVPLSTLGNEYWHYDRDSQTLMGSDSGLTIALGTPALVRLKEADGLTGGLIFEMLELDGKSLPTGSTRSRGKPQKRKLARSRAKSRKISRKAGRK
ncbi:ribonuclease R [Algicella marina]|uniref:Ribonuclease R n=1 Tax=Algicella marina TaxID=2683284 RepID=A0A6P1T2C7_9RHOB|nr:ribonuclease R [Algicella marina]QHQ35871.1 ribonuclease R [Algicella marina]